MSYEWMRIFASIIILISCNHFRLFLSNSNPCWISSLSKKKRKWSRTPCWSLLKACKSINKTRHLTKLNIYWCETDWSNFLDIYIYIFFLNTTTTTTIRINNNSNDNEKRGEEEELFFFMTTTHTPIKIKYCHFVQT